MGEADGRLEVAELLLEANADPNATDNSGEGPLFEGTCNGDQEACELLLHYGAKQSSDEEISAADVGDEATAPVTAPVAEPPFAAEDGAPQDVVLSMKYVTAQGKDWSLRKLRGNGSNASTNTEDSCDNSAPGSSDDESSNAGSRASRPAPTRSVASYLVCEEERSWAIYLKLEELFEGASLIFTNEDTFAVQASPDQLSVSFRGPASASGSEEVNWELVASLPANVDITGFVLRLRRGKLSVKLPKMTGGLQSTTAEEEARAEARSLHPQPQQTRLETTASADQESEAKDSWDVAEAMRLYGQQVAGALHDEGKATMYQRKAFPWKTDAGWTMNPRRDEVRAELEEQLRCEAARTRRSGQEQFPADAERGRVCSHCRLPIGDFAYATEGKEQSYLHGECLAQLRLRDLQKEEQARKKHTAELKKKRRAKYDIGWKVERVPRSLVPATKLNCRFLPQGMCCLIYDEDSHCIAVAPTLDPAGSVNLEYLSLALQVRMCEGREPTFSLDLPAEAPGSPDTWMQKKRFDPEWLAGTSVGEVMFQADYHLKELSMGEYEQPVVGMKSCFDHSEMEGLEHEWRAREWFVVKDAEVNLNDRNMLIPSVRMGVEAREQIKGEDGLEDTPITRPDHPLVKYAEAFTHNFDLIAERKSVIHHLRELAKATVLAKFVVDADLFLDEAWLDLADEPTDKGFSEIPQLWNERAYSQIRVQDGALVHGERGDGRGSMRGVYGGVEFGVDRFQLSRPGRLAPPGASGMVVSKPGAVSFGMDRFRISRPKRVASVVSAAVAPSVPSAVSAVSAVVPESREYVPEVEPAMVRSSRPRSAVVSAVSRVSAVRPSAVRAAEPVAAQPLTAIVQSRLVQRPTLVQRPGAWQAPSLQGVDLGLDKFNLSEATRVQTEDGGLASALDSLDATVAIGGAFWKSLDSEDGAFQEEDWKLLADVFNPNLSDRRDEGDQFVPPDSSPQCLKTLRQLVAEEASVREQRNSHFLSTKFVMEEPGELFPSSWTTTIGIARKSENARRLQIRPDYKAEARMFDEVLKSAAPIFDKATEDGVRFRVYRIGSLEVRTTQGASGKEAIGAIFSEVRCSSKVLQKPQDGEEVVKVTEYVEQAPGGGDGGCRYYVVFETDQGTAVATERLEANKASWEENPKDLEDRNSMAKVVRSVDCRGSSSTLGDLKLYRWGSGGGCSGRRYADGVYEQATGEVNRSGFGFEQHYERMQ